MPTLSLRFPAPTVLPALLLTLLLPSLARAATLNVPTPQYPTVQAAVTAASNGDTVLLADGTYTGDGNRDIDFGGKNLTVTSQHGANSTVIDCGGSSSANHRGFYIHSGETNAVLSGLTIKNGYETYNGVNNGEGGGVLIVGSSATVQDCSVTGSTASYGGGLYNGTSVGGMITLTGCAITGNTAFNGGGGVSNGGGADQSVGVILLTGCTLSGNAATSGGAAGGGVYNDSDLGTISLTGCTLTANTAYRGGAVYNLTGGGRIDLAGCTISGNMASGNGGGVYNQNNAGMITLTGCTLSGNTANSSGGALYNGNGPATLTACTLTGNSGQVGGAASNNGTMTLDACVFSGNSAINGLGGGVGNGGALTLTGCTFSGNSAPSGGGGAVLNSGTSLTLVNDVLYGDTGGEIDNYTGGGGGTNVMAAYCDVQGGIDASDAANHVLNVDPLFVSATDLHLLSTSPVIAQGTGDAPGFLPADRDGKPYFTPPALGAYEGPQDAASDTHVLWTNPDGKALVWDVNARGGHLVAGTYGPYADDGSGNTGYVASSLATGPDGVSYLLWTNPARVTYLWVVQRDGSHVDYRYGPFSDDGTQGTLWQAVSVSAGGDGRVHLLWTNPDGRTILWDVQSDGSFAIAANYDPQPGFTAFALASGSDGLSHILWNGAGGLAMLWNLDASAQPAASTYGPFSDDGTASTLWSARALSVGPDNVPHLLWNNPNGRTILWDVNSDGSFTIPGNYDAFADDASGDTNYTAVALATGSDGLSHFAWDNLDGNTFLWSVQPDGSHADTFYGPFYDGASVWKAVAVSAAEVPTF